MQVGVITKNFLNLGKRRHFAITVVSAMLLSACASTGPTWGDTQASIEPLLNQAANEFGKGRRDQAIALLNQAAKESPTNATPWLKMANIWFDEANYSSSVLAANEVLARDESNHEAKSLLVVSGLRIAAKAAQGLVPHNPVNPNARKEAEDLTKSLRLALGEQILVPAESEKTVTAAPRARKKMTARVHINSHAVANIAATATTSSKPAITTDTAATPLSQKISLTVPTKVVTTIDPFKSLK